MDFNNKIIWITGASSGLGAELAIQLSAHGAILIISGRNVESLKEVSENCKGETKIINFDLSLSSERREIFEKHSEILSKVDILVHNAGVSQRAFAHQTSIEVYKQLMETNYMGPVFLSLNILDFFRIRKKGHFILISSMAGKFGVPLRSGYSASKMAIQGFFETLKAENRDHGIDVTMVYPSFIKTNISAKALKGDGSEYGIDDEGQKNGVSVEKSAKIIIKNIQNRADVVYIGKWGETVFANLLHFVFPKLFHKLLNRTFQK